MKIFILLLACVALPDFMCAMEWFKKGTLNDGLGGGNGPPPSRITKAPSGGSPRPSSSGSSRPHSVTDDDFKLRAMERFGKGSLSAGLGIGNIPRPSVGSKPSFSGSSRPSSSRSSRPSSSGCSRPHSITDDDFKFPQRVKFDPPENAGNRPMKIPPGSTIRIEVNYGQVFLRGTLKAYVEGASLSGNFGHVIVGSENYKTSAILRVVGEHNEELTVTQKIINKALYFRCFIETRRNGNYAGNLISFPLYTDPLEWPVMVAMYKPDTCRPIAAGYLSRTPDSLRPNWLPQGY